MATERQIENYILDKDFIADPFEVQVDEATFIRGYLVLNHPDIHTLDLPDGIHAYPIRHRDDDDSIPSTLENENVLVNYYGLFLTGADLDWMFAERDAFIEILEWGYYYI